MQLIKEFLPEAERKPVPQDCLSIKFGRYFTHHMLITKLTDLPLHPAAVVLHYAQEIFEGTKAFTTKSSGRIALFRIQLSNPGIQSFFYYSCLAEKVVESAPPILHGRAEGYPPRIFVEHKRSYVLELIVLLCLDGCSIGSEA